MSPFRTEPVRVRVPATSANLGPGFDCAALALTLYDDVVVRATGGGLTVSISGEGAGDLPRDERHLLVTALRASFDALGGQPRGLELRCVNRIPQARGLGSSSAAIVAAIVAARALLPDGDERLDDLAALQLGTELEGHHDNVSAALAGGLTLSWTGPSGVRSHRLDPHPSLAPVAFVPTTRASTAAVRALLPVHVTHAEAAANSACAALLPVALTCSPELLLVATEDRLHQSYRSGAMPGTSALVGTLRAAGIPAVVSGAGPTVLALSSRDAAGAVAARAPAGWGVLELAVEPAGASVMRAP